MKEVEVGYVFLSIEAGKRLEVIRRIREIPAVKEAKLVLGVFDAVAKIVGETVDDLERTFFNEVNKVSGITSSRLYVVACPRTRK